MCQTLGIRQAAQTEILMGWHNLQDRKYSELRPAKRVRRAVDKLLLRRAYDKARQENPALERLFAQEREQAVVQMNLSAEKLRPCRRAYEQRLRRFVLHAGYG